MLIHVLHFTVATKQPAMTAAALASTVQHRKGSKMAQIAELAALIINIIRTQFVAILGNISIAIPVAALIAFSWDAMLHEPLMSHAKASHLLHDFESVYVTCHSACRHCRGIFISVWFDCRLFR